MTDGNGRAAALASVLDGDDPAAALSEAVVAELASAAEVEAAVLFARLRTRWPRAGVWRDLRRAVAERRRAGRRAEPDDRSDDRPDVRATEERHVVVCAAERALGASGAEVFVRCGRLVRVRRDARAAGVARDEDAPTIEAATAPWLGTVLSCVARWHVVREGEDGPERRYLPAPPPDVVAATLDLGSWPSLRPLVGLAEGPVLRADGSVATAAGYDAASGRLLLHDPAAWPAVGVVDRAGAAEAFAELLAPFAQFPFVAPSDRAALGALVLTLLARPAIDGPVPIFGVDATAAGTGKSLAASAAGVVGTGRRPAVATWPRRTEEARKVLLALALGGDPLVLLDNVEGDLASGELAAAVTAGTVRDRVLGATEMVSVPWRATLVVTGNQLTFRGDLARRAVLVRLDARSEAPDERDGWEHPDLVAHVRAHRPRLAAAGLRVLLAHRAEAPPRPPDLKAPLGSFEAWDRVVREAVFWATGADPLARRAELRDADPEREAIAALFAAWVPALGVRGVLARTAAECEAKPDALGPEREAVANLRDALDALCERGVTARSVGYLFRRLAGRKVGGRTLVRDGKAGEARAVRWRVASEGEAWGPATEPEPTDDGAPDPLFGGGLAP